MKRTLAFLGLFGILITCLSLSTIFFNWPLRPTVDIRATSIPDASVKVNEQLILTHPDAPVFEYSGRLVSNLELPQSVKYPSSVSISLKMTLELDSPKLIRGVIGHPSWKASGSDEIRSAMLASPPKVQLHLAGADVSPAEGRRLSRDAEMKWSVNPKVAQDYEGYISISEGRQEFRVPSGMAIIEWPTQIPVSIQVREPIARKLIQGVVAFMGTLLTLPGIIAFVRARRDEKRRREEEEAGESRIIVP